MYRITTVNIDKLIVSYINSDVIYNKCMKHLERNKKRIKCHYFIRYGITENSKQIFTDMDIISIKVYADILIVCTQEGVIKFDIEHNKVLWFTNAYHYSGHITIKNDKIYVEHNGLTVLSLNDGKILYNYNANGYEYELVYSDDKIRIKQSGYFTDMNICAVNTTDNVSNKLVSKCNNYKGIECEEKYTYIDREKYPETEHNMICFFGQLLSYGKGCLIFYDSVCGTDTLWNSDYKEIRVLDFTGMD
jgi:hypothetical protein